MRVDRAGRGAGRGRRRTAPRPAMPKRTSLPSSCRRRRAGGAVPGAASLEPRLDDGDADADQSTAITASDRAALPLVADHPAEGAGQGERDDQEQEDLEEVGERVGVLERVRGVGVEEAAAVGAELLDRLLAGDRAARDRPAVAAASTVVTSVGAVEVLDHAAGDEHDRRDERRAAAGCAAIAADRGRPRSCRACRCRGGRGRGSGRRRRRCRPRPTRSSAPPARPSA